MQNLRATNMIIPRPASSIRHLTNKWRHHDGLDAPLIIADKGIFALVVAVTHPNQLDPPLELQQSNALDTSLFQPFSVGRTQRKEGTPHRRTLQRRRKEPRTQPSPLPEILRPPEMGRNRTHSPSLRQNRRGAPVQPGTTKERVSVCNTQQTRKRDTHTGKS